MRTCVFRDSRACVKASFQAGQHWWQGRLAQRQVCHSQVPAHHERLISSLPWMLQILLLLVRQVLFDAVLG